MADQMEELIKEIAAKHGITVPRDDPILFLQTINQVRNVVVQTDFQKASVHDFLPWVSPHNERNTSEEFSAIFELRKPPETQSLAVGR